MKVEVTYHPPKDRTAKKQQSQGFILDILVPGTFF